MDGQLSVTRQPVVVGKDSRPVARKMSRRMSRSTMQTDRKIPLREGREGGRGRLRREGSGVIGYRPSGEEGMIKDG